MEMEDLSCWAGRMGRMPYNSRVRAGIEGKTIFKRPAVGTTHHNKSATPSRIGHGMEMFYS